MHRSYKSRPGLFASSCRAAQETNGASAAVRLQKSTKQPSRPHSEADLVRTPTALSTARRINESASQECWFRRARQDVCAAGYGPFAGGRRALCGGPRTSLIESCRIGRGAVVIVFLRRRCGCREAPSVGGIASAPKNAQGRARNVGRSHAATLRKAMSCRRMKAESL